MMKPFNNQFLNAALESLNLFQTSAIYLKEMAEKQANKADSQARDCNFRI